ncbi:predicted protein [Coccidioides posadasii str. Silveira]|uniref:Predicted protein n=1 Tax=Coccidioides posadasii (strain RMSCC 757 / Silveira) TaxID=443226 RepID=E9DDW4_COCPS|nr:predicted protein [Coccidioides posadasii str. Silveira]
MARRWVETRMLWHASALTQTFLPPSMLATPVFGKGSWFMLAKGLHSAYLNTIRRGDTGQMISWRHIDTQAKVANPGQSRGQMYAKILGLHSSEATVNFDSRAPSHKQ